MVVLLGNPKSDKDPNNDCLFVTSRVTDVDIDANFKPLNLPFNEVNQMAGAATRAPERSPHGLH